MKKMAIIPVILAGSMLVWSHDHNRGHAHLELNGKHVSVEYGRPELRGRDMMAQAEVGMIWRMGADAATTLKSDADLVFVDKVVPKGEYTLFAKKVGDGQWHLLINSAKDIMVRDRDPEKDVAEVPMKATALPENVEKFTIELKNQGNSTGELSMAWAQTKLSIEFSVR